MRLFSSSTARRVEVKEKKDRVDDAMHATKAAVAAALRVRIFGKP